MENEKYIVSARKYRPATFGSVVGQKALVNTLRNAVMSNRLAQAYLFCGPRGVGKTSCARIFAKTINCQNLTPEGEACGECESCKAIEAGNSFNLMELDAASNNSVNDIRNLTDMVGSPPQIGRYRVFIIDEVHMLTTSAFNAFLKTLEEPPSYVIFILATTEKHKVLPTILSRCQIYDFRRITPADMADHLAYVASQEGIETERQALDVIARKADGAMRDALSIFDQVAASSRGHVTYQAAIENLNILDYDYYFQLVEAFRAGDVARSLLLYAQIREKGFDSLFFVNGLANHIRDLMMGASEATLSLMEQSEEVKGRYRQQASQLPLDWYYAALKLLSDCDQAYRTATEKRLLVELTLIRLCQLLNPPTPPFDRVEGEAPVIQPILPSPQPTTPVQPSPTPAATPSSSPMPAAPAPSSSVSPPPSPSPSPAPAHEPEPVRPVSTPVPSKPSKSRRRPNSINLSPTLPEAHDKPRTEKTETGGDDPTSPATPAAPQGGDNQPYTDDQLAAAWNRFIILHQDRRVLCSSMRNLLPQRIGEDRFRVTVGHQAEMNAYNSDKYLLTEYLRQELRNNAIVLEFELNTEQEQRHYLTQQEFLADVVKTNPVLGQFIQQIDAAEA